MSAPPPAPPPASSTAPSAPAKAPPAPSKEYRADFVEEVRLRLYESVVEAGAFEGDGVYRDAMSSSWLDRYAASSAYADLAARRAPVPSPCVVGVFYAVFGPAAARRRAEVGRVYWAAGPEGAALGAPAAATLGPPRPAARGEVFPRAVSGNELAALAAAAAELDEVATAATARGELALEASFAPAAGAAAAARAADARRLAPAVFAAALGDPYTTRDRAVGAAARGEPDFEELVRWLDAAAPGAAKRARRAVYDLAAPPAPGAALWVAPLHARELASPGDVALPLWRDLVVSAAAADLAANFVCGGFLRLAPAALLAAGAPLAATAAGRVRADRSEAVAATLETLERERSRIGAALSEVQAESAAPGGAAVAESAEHAELADAAAAIAAAADLAATCLVESGTYLVAPCATAFCTLGDFAAALAAAAAAPVAPGDVPGRAARPDGHAMFAAPGDAARVLFEIAYALDCLHARLGVALGAPGAESFGVFDGSRTHCLVLGAENAVAVEIVPDPAVVYVAGARGAGDCFMFRASSLLAGVCDTGRALVGPAFRPRLEARAPAEVVSALYRDQTGRAMRVLSRAAPALVAARGDELAALAAARWDAVFPAVCAADFAAAGAAASAALAPLASAAGPAGPLACPEALALAAALRRAGEEAVVEILGRLLAEGAPPPGSAPPLPGPPLLRSVFAPWHLDAIIAAARGRPRVPPEFVGWAGRCEARPAPRGPTNLGRPPGRTVVGVFAREAPLERTAAAAPWLRFARGEFEAPPKDQ